MDTKDDGDKNSWTFGTCSGGYYYPGYPDNAITHEMCCQPAGSYELLCKSSSDNGGWHGGYLEIDGQEYCKYFDNGSKELVGTPIKMTDGKRHLWCHVIFFVVNEN